MAQNITPYKIKKSNYSNIQTTGIKNKNDLLLKNKLLIKQVSLLKVLLYFNFGIFTFFAICVSLKYRYLVSKNVSDQNSIITALKIENGVRKKKEVKLQLVISRQKMIINKIYKIDLIEQFIKFLINKNH